MTIPDPQVFSDLTETSLQDLEMAAHSRAANLRKSIARQLEMWVEEVAVATMCRWMLEHRKELNIRPGRAARGISEGLLP